MIKTGSLRKLWDHCIKLEAFIHLSTSNNIYMTNGKVPETIMTGSTANISCIRNNVSTFPDDKLILGLYLGPVTDVGWH
jgi:hypothetical protein